MNPKIIDRICDDSVSFGTKVRIPKKDFKTSKDRVNYAKNKTLLAVAVAEIKEIKKSKTNSRELTELTRRKQRALAAAEINKISSNSRKLTNLERRKQHKVRYDTWRRQEMPNEEDMSLENIHYANFLGDKYCDNGAPYNTEYPVNVRFCDAMAEYYQPEEYEHPAIDIDENSHARKMRRMNNARGDDDSLLMTARLLDGEFDSEYSHSPGYASDENSYVDPHAYIAEYAEDDMSALSLGSDSDLWSLDGGDNEYCPFDEVDATSERIAAAFKDMHQLTQYYNEHIERAITIFNEFENNKRHVDEAYDNEPAPQPALKRARCDDESYNV